MMKQGRKEKVYEREQQNGNGTDCIHRALKMEMNIAFITESLCVRYYIKYFICTSSHLITMQVYEVGSGILILLRDKLRQATGTKNPVQKLQQRLSRAAVGDTVRTQRS